GRGDCVRESAGRSGGGERGGAGGRAAEAGRGLGGRFGCWVRQARRYVDQAVAGGTVAVPEPGVVFTVKLPGRLAAAVREHAWESGRTISKVVAQALEEFLERGHRNHPRRGAAGKPSRRSSSTAMRPPRCRGPTRYWCRTGGAPAGGGGRGTGRRAAPP